ncbi:unnamed protein product [Effrenium voratum]|uniref:MaoC-like domain-containing protein n=1 Tax=Effrenium voratum TaxID=2562239 RepID=A0AA36IW80_9DINO|nr:unnamed protein product [Effrenium voratum]
MRWASALATCAMFTRSIRTLQRFRPFPWCSTTRVHPSMRCHFLPLSWYPTQKTVRGNQLLLRLEPYADPGDSGRAAFPSPPMKNVKVWLDAGVTIERLADLPTAGRMKVEGGVASVHRKGKGAFLEKLHELKDEAGKVYYRMIDASFCVGATDFEEFGQQLTTLVQMPKRSPEKRRETKLEERAAMIYRLSGDYNPLHLDPEFAKTAGFETPIVHGKCTLGHTARCLLDTLAGGDHRRFRSLALRYSSPVIPGQTLVVEMWETNAPEEYLFQVLVKETGKVCVSNGRLLLHAASRL